jgi:hypothetical protein
MLIFHLDQFDNLLNNIISMRNSYVRSIRVALTVFLVKMRLGVSNRVLASLFHLKNKRVVSRIIHEVTEALLKDFVPYHLGFQHIDRKTILQHHQISIASQLMADQDDQVIVVMDGTYLYVQKSSNNKFQRRSFSMHKHRHLIKPMITTATVSITYSYFECITSLEKLLERFILNVIYICYTGRIHLECGGAILGRWQK